MDSRGQHNERGTSGKEFFPALIECSDLRVTLSQLRERVPYGHAQEVSSCSFEGSRISLYSFENSASRGKFLDSLQTSIEKAPITADELLAFFRRDQA